MKDKKGFTLVELIAVIAILGVILLLVIPNIVDMFNEGRKDAFVRQIQSIWKEAENAHAVDVANDINTYVYSSIGTGKTLSLGANDITYMVGLDSNGTVKFVAVGDKNFCYVSSSPNNINITRESVVEEKINCSGNTCTCGSTSGTVGGFSGGSNIEEGENGHYAYWSIREGGDREIYAPNEMPSTTYSSYMDALDRDPETIIRTTLDDDGNPIKHETCLYHNYRLFCTGDKYYNSGYIDYEDFREEMEDTLKSIASECYGWDGTSAWCTFGCGCGVYNEEDRDEIATCDNDYERCVILKDGSAKCFE